MLEKLTDDFLADVCMCCSVTDLGALLAANNQFYVLILPYFIDACKRYCFIDFLTPTIAAYRMNAQVPRTWPKLYSMFTCTRNLKWVACEPEMSTSLRKLKVDPTEYTLDGKYLMRCGGHYLFGLWQVAFDNIVIESDSLTLEMNGWEKIRPHGFGPCPRRNHAIIALPNIYVENAVPIGYDTFQMHYWRRLLIFGGQAEGYPFQSFNDLYLCCMTSEKKTGKTKAIWIEPETSGLPPPPRSGHVATLVNATTVLYSGGSSGTTAIPTLEIFLLHQLDDYNGEYGLGAFRWSKLKCSEYPPMGRTMHAVYQPNRIQPKFYIFGGKQIRESNGLFDCHILEFQDKNLTEYTWSKPDINGDKPTDRRGHSTTAIGNRTLLVFGGQDSATHQLDNTIYQFDAKNLCWKIPYVIGTPPCARRGHKMQYFGTTMIVQSGFILNGTTANEKLPEHDAYNLTFE
ncbi:hypothetical protein THRCLA_05735 [Thraustotheca clavata]|uniref:Uncharacterized protein n=1 Tax=Thraustotheca clavata TaxID=74557 RepID=A0A1V9ZV23_9STRA|nr:hypothetical protein THRCLA_05735 [Thraustotheca clavata]